MYTKNSTFKLFYQFILIYRVNIGKRAILNKNIGIIGHFLIDRDFIGIIGMLEGLYQENDSYQSLDALKKFSS